MFALFAVVLFGSALLLKLLGAGGGWQDVVVTAGLLCVALHLVWSVPMFGRHRP